MRQTTSIGILWSCALLIATVAVLAAADESQSACFADCADGLSGKEDQGPKPGDLAPGFEAYSLTDSGRAIYSGTLIGKRPLILAFGSFT